MNSSKDKKDRQRQTDRQAVLFEPHEPTDGDDMPFLYRSVRHQHTLRDHRYEAGASR